jgi:hypothetical protein
MPIIQHPSARLAAPETISLAGRSTRFSELQRLEEVQSIAPSWDILTR